MSADITSISEGQPTTPRLERSAKRQATSKRRKKGCCHQIGETYNTEPEKFIFAQRALQTTATIFSLTNVKDGSSFTRILPIPFMTPLDFLRARNRFSMVKTAAKLGKTQEAIFNVVKLIDVASEPLGNISSLASMVIQYSGYAQMAAVGVIFTVILPKFFLATTLIGLTGDMWGLMRSVAAYREFCKRKGNEDFAALIDALDFARQGKPIPDDITDRALRKKMQQFSENVHTAHTFRSDRSAHEKKAEINALFQKMEALITRKQTFLQKLDPKITEMASDAITHAFATDLKSASALLALDQCHEKIQGTLQTLHPQPHSEVLDQIRTLRQAFQELVTESRSVKYNVESEMRRLILNNIIVVLIDLLALASSISSNDSQSNQSRDNASICSMTACLLQMGLILFEKKVSEKNYKRLENAFLQQKPPR